MAWETRACIVDGCLGTFRVPADFEPGVEEKVECSEGCHLSVEKLPTGKLDVKQRPDDPADEMRDLLGED
jgi:hypothetical protein